MATYHRSGKIQAELEDPMSNRALFLSRDGVVNLDKGYVHKPKDVKFVDGIFELCKQAQSLDYKIIITTNQPGIGKGVYTESDFQTLMNWMYEQFSGQGIQIAETYVCPEPPESASEDCKPSPGMLLKAKEAFDLSMRGSVMVGDRDEDMKAAKSAGIPSRVLYGGEASMAATRTVSDLRHAAIDL
jgi:D-glycero-D-manno-heptose 1,7-bisphosphate phosphatase